MRRSSLGTTNISAGPITAGPIAAGGALAAPIFAVGVSRIDLDLLTLDPAARAAEEGLALLAAPFLAILCRGVSVTGAFLGPRLRRPATAPGGLGG